jgi:FtsP/CotA-like multicopper oxidase with cupredoxin domain
MPLGYQGTFTVTAVNVPNAFFPANFAFRYTATATGLATVNQSSTAAASIPKMLDGHVDARQIMDVGVMNGNIPAPLMAIDEDDEFFLTLTNVGMIMRPDLFEQHTVHFHGYPNASAFYDGVPDASVAINIGASFTYYYLAPDAGTYFWHCHITPPEHLQMGMVGQLYVRPRQNRVAAGANLYTARATQDTDLRTACVSAHDILCSNPLPIANTGTTHTAGATYAYNDGDGSTRYDVEYPLQIHGFDPNFHFVGMTFNPEGFADMKDKYFLLNGRSYPDTVSPGPLQTQSADGVNHFSQPLPAIITIPHGGRALLRISDLDVSEYQTLASLGIPMQVIGYNAKLLRDEAGNNLYYMTNSITLGGGESLDVILDACAVRGLAPTYTCTTPMAAGTYYLYTPNLDHLSNDAENFGGLMTEVHVN